MASALNCSVCQDVLQPHPTFGDSELKTIFENRDANGSTPVNCVKLLELIANSANPLDVPICKTCCVSMSEDLAKQLNELDKECVEYQNVYKHLVEMKDEINTDETANKAKLEELIREENDLTEELNSLLKNEAKLVEELKQRQAEQKNMLEKDDDLYRKLRDNHKMLSEQADEQRSLKAQLNYTSDQLAKLSKTNVLDMAFFIWKNGEYGTINGLRLGRLPNDNVDWHEINAAFGQVAMLMVVMCQHVGLQPKGLEIVPFGSHSFIRVTKTDGKLEEYQLYGTGSWKPFGLSSLDHGIVSYLDCFCQLENKLKERFPKADRILPYRMVKDKIIDQDSQYLVRMQLNSEERWTKAMKCMLLNLKRVVGILADSRVAAENARNWENP